MVFWTASLWLAHEARETRAVRKTCPLYSAALASGLSRRSSATRAWV
jgi:hypothetical protein